MTESKDIYTRLASFDTNENTSFSMFNNRFELTTFIVSGISFAIFIVSFLLNIFVKYSYWLFILGLLSLLLYSLAYFVKGILTIYNPTKSYIEGLKERLDKENIILNELSGYEKRELKEARERFKLEKENLTNRFGFLLGAMDKLGLIPALIALYLSYSKAMNDPTLSKIPDLLLFLLAGIYLGAFLVRHISERLSVFILLLERAEEKVKSLDKLK